jgi:hypothetical protein
MNFASVCDDVSLLYRNGGEVGVEEMQTEKQGIELGTDGK